ncbi:hypothetical protein [Lacimicrobium alkaliphilum]|uniref:DUF4412 domain-containing protein n=1 Tax=Lacimicrobium alkaliphilum TaxID=1526571 RepID=A0A0U2PKD6_9ALTE|nr:hypothetical protein [Lacimicrobium alkaliphilum]ALT00046.1 hypothetical protein AT746_18405 [Lacimicrobium alkaliphilum]
MQAKIWLVSLLLCFSALTRADSDYDGTHGMVVFTHESGLYASHMPMHTKPHDAQIIYKISPGDPFLYFLAKDADLVTIKPETFNLQHLMQGEKLTVKADVYMGHFERGGSLQYEQMEVTFLEQKYFRMIEPQSEPSTLQVYDEVELDRGGRMLVHQIRGVPSYDHLILVFENIGCIRQFDVGQAVPKEAFLINRLSACGSMKPLYYETQDFAAK